jgi:hypothetical protein
MDLTYKIKGKDIRMSPFNKFEMEDGHVVALYQGCRGQYPELDFIVKYKKDGLRLRTPSHTHWIVDLIIKSECNKKLTLELIKDFIEIYDKTEPFNTKRDRETYNLVHTKNVKNKYKDLESKGNLSIEILVTFIELFSICEKRTKGAFMFKNLLVLCKDYLEGKKDYYQIISYSKRV